MKKTAIILSLLISVLKAQITIESTYPSMGSGNYFAMNVVRLSAGYKYTHFDRLGKILRIYNLNHSIWKTINLPVPSGFQLYDVPKHITDSLFKLDANVELAYTYYATTSYTNGTSPTYTSVTKVIDDAGSTLLTINQCMQTQLVHTGTNGYRMIAQVDSVNKIWTSGVKEYQVFKLIGSLPVTHTSSSTEPTGLSQKQNSQNPILSSPNPNPSGNKTVIGYDLPFGIEQTELVIFDITGNEVKRYFVDRNFNTLELDNTELISGTYFYKILGVSEAKKMIIVK